VRCRTARAKLCQKAPCWHWSRSASACSRPLPQPLAPIIAASPGGNGSSAAASTTALRRRSEILKRPDDGRPWPWSSGFPQVFGQPVSCWIESSVPACRPLSILRRPIHQKPRSPARQSENDADQRFLCANFRQSGKNLLLQCSFLGNNNLHRKRRRSHERRETKVAKKPARPRPMANGRFQSRILGIFWLEATALT